MSDQILYACTLNGFDRRQLFYGVGERATVLEAALRIALDFAPAWSPSAPSPVFTLSVQKVKP